MIGSSHSQSIPTAGKLDEEIKPVINTFNQHLVNPEFIESRMKLEDEAYIAGSPLKLEDDILTMPVLSREFVKQLYSTGSIPNSPSPPELLPGIDFNHSSSNSIFPTASTSSLPHASTNSLTTDTRNCSVEPQMKVPGSDTRIEVRKKSKKVQKSIATEKIQLISHLPSAEEEASKTYTVLDQCTYASKALGNFAFFDQDSMNCDCSYDEDEDITEQACGFDAQCMNRLMQIECIETECRCGTNCQNQRFNKKEYAPIEVVKTEMKGFGVRITCDLPADTFIYEYIGEVIGPTLFKKKMKEYAAEGIRHFYFMALDKEIYIDATKKGGKGRFLNHSCNPNCVVAKWTVGSKMRMGIFTKRDVKENEELTFNYNVDRYGHEAQICHCGEANCVGSIGGKTQTDIGGMDDLYLDALGIAEEVERLGLRGTKKKKGKQMDEDFIPLLKPIDFDEVPKVSAAIRQALSNRRILEKLLIRIQITENEEVLLQLLRLHGHSLMSHILREHKEDLPIVILGMEILTKWPLKTRNKIESSKIEESIQCCLSLHDSKVAQLGRKLLDEWELLELGYRIPKATRVGQILPDRKRAIDFTIDQIAKKVRTTEKLPEESQRIAFIKPAASIGLTTGSNTPEGWITHKDQNSGKIYYENLMNKIVQWDLPKEEKEVGLNGPTQSTLKAFDVNAIIAQANAEVEKLAAKEVEKMAEELAEKKRLKSLNKSSPLKKKETNVDGLKEKKMKNLFSNIVVNVMSKYKSHLSESQFKKRAKEVTQMLCEKEAKQQSYTFESYDSISPEKTVKIQLFTKNWIKKLIERKKPFTDESTRLSAITTSSIPFTDTAITDTASSISPSTLNSFSPDSTSSHHFRSTNNSEPSPSVQDTEFESKSKINGDLPLVVEQM